MSFPTPKSLKILKFAHLELELLTYLSSEYFNIEIIQVRSFQTPNTFNVLKEAFKHSQVIFKYTLRSLNVCLQFNAFE